MIHTENTKENNLENSLLNVVQKLSEELHGSSLRRLTLESDLAKDAGIDSLARIELLLRIERNFGTALPEEEALGAATIKDLFTAISETGKIQPAPTASAVIPELDKRHKLQPPEEADTLADVLMHYAEKFPDAEYIRYLPTGEGEGEPLTYAQFFEGARLFASGLLKGGYAPGRCTAIMLPTGFDYLFSFFGSILAGNIPVPIYPPQNKKHIEEHLRRQISILKNSEAVALITVPEALQLRFLLKSALVNLKDVITPDDLRNGGTGQIVLPQSGDTAFLQYTSGTTGLPKGVVLSHENLLSNVRSMGAAIRIEENDRFISWLPLYHDMGLIGAVFGTLYHGVPLVLMSPLSFIARPGRWLDAISRYRGTISAAPNFAYDLCANSIPDKLAAGLDLSSWRLAFNGAEPISPATILKFIERFSASGFRKTSFYPVYGLAENSVGLSFPPPGRGARFDTVKREIFTNEGRAEPSNHPEDDLVFVGCGSAIPENKIRIVLENGEEAPDRTVGNIQFISPSSTAGYYKNPEATEALFCGGWLDSGDKGYMADGELFITGRKKEIIIRGGRNIYPYELEEAIGSIEGIRAGGVAVFSVRGSDGMEKMVIVAESREQKKQQKEALKQKISELCVSLHQFAPDDIVIAPVRTVLRTSSGKIRRGSVKSLYEGGKIGKSPSVKMQMLRLGLYSAPGRIKRIFQTAVSYLYGAYFWITFGLALIPGIMSFLLMPTVKIRFASIRFILKIFFPAAGIRVKICGKENLINSDQVIYVSNHTSYMDGVLVMLTVPFPVRFIAKSELKKNFFTRILLNKLNVFYVDRFDAKSSVRDAENISRKGGNPAPLFFFAEGTFTKEEGLKNFRMGAFTTAVKNQSRIIPVSIRGARTLLRDETFIPQRCTVELTFAKPVASEKTGWDGAIELRNKTREAILSHCGEKDIRSFI